MWMSRIEYTRAVYCGYIIFQVSCALIWVYTVKYVHERVCQTLLPSLPTVTIALFNNGTKGFGMIEVGESQIHKSFLLPK